MRVHLSIVANAPLDVFFTVFYNEVMADNKVFFRENDIIEIQVVGVQNIASVDVMGRDTSVLLTQLRAKGKPCLVLDDLTQMGEVDAAGRKKVVELGKHLDFDRCAMVGKGGILRIGANLMLHAIGRADKIRYFSSREEALAWLLEKKIPAAP